METSQMPLNTDDEYNAMYSILDGARKLTAEEKCDPRLATAAVAMAVIYGMASAMDDADASLFLSAIRHTINSDLMDAQTPAH